MTIIQPKVPRQQNHFVSLLLRLQQIINTMLMSVATQSNSIRSLRSAWWRVYQCHCENGLVTPSPHLYSTLPPKHMLPIQTCIHKVNVTHYDPKTDSTIHLAVLHVLSNRRPPTATPQNAVVPRRL